MDPAESPVLYRYSPEHISIDRKDTKNIPIICPSCKNADTQPATIITKEIQAKVRYCFACKAFWH